MHFFSNPFRVTFSLCTYTRVSVFIAPTAVSLQGFELLLLFNDRTSDELMLKLVLVVHFCNCCWAATNLFSSLTLHFNWFYSSAMCGLFSPFSHSDCIGSVGWLVGYAKESNHKARHHPPPSPHSKAQPALEQSSSRINWSLSNGNPLEGHVQKQQCKPLRIH